MQKWSISIPVDGNIPKNIEPIKIDDVLFHIGNRPDSNTREFFATVVLDGNYPEVEAKALILIDNALTKFQFIHQLPLTLKNDEIHTLDYSKAGDPDSPKIGPRRLRSTLSIWYRIGKDDTKEIISKMQSMKPDKKDAFEIALTYYRVAVCSINPYQAIESFFGCVHSIVREEIGKTNNVSQSDLEKGLLQVVGSHVVDFHKKFQTFYGRRRSAASHGHINILDATEIEDAKQDANELKIWVRKLLVTFLDKHQISIHNSNSMDHRGE